LVVDPYCRPVTSIRVSITQKCNLHCFYCHQEGEDYNKYNHAEMTPEEIEEIISVVASFGIGKVKLTGGEPLMRSDILEIVERISSIHGVSEVSMTTNGTFLNDLAKPLKEAGLARVNVSLDTLNPKAYEMITGLDALEKVVSGIKKAVEANLNPVKVNTVLLKGINDNEVWNMIEFAKGNDVILQLIELESAREDEFYRKHHYEMTKIENELRKRAERVTVRSMHHRRKYFLRSNVEVEIVRPMHNTEFCRYCNRMRVTSDGKFKPCLFRSDNLVDFLGPMRNGASTEDLKKLFLEAVKRRKPYFM
jgi:cyclic pyranopterin phosphate synthase